MYEFVGKNAVIIIPIIRGVCYLLSGEVLAIYTDAVLILQAKITRFIPLNDYETSCIIQESKLQLYAVP